MSDRFSSPPKYEKGLKFPTLVRAVVLNSKVVSFQCIKPKILHESPQDVTAKMSQVLAFSVQRKGNCATWYNSTNFLSVKPNDGTAENMMEVHLLVIPTLHRCKTYVSMEPLKSNSVD